MTPRTLALETNERNVAQAKTITKRSLQSVTSITHKNSPKSLKKRLKIHKTYN
jgi:hypothetical protein